MPYDINVFYNNYFLSKEQLETTGLTDEFKYGLKMDKKEITEELQLRSAQIIELKQKILDSNEGKSVILGIKLNIFQLISNVFVLKTFTFSL